MKNTTGVSQNRELAIRILEEIAYRLGNEDFFDNIGHTEGVEGNGEWYVYEDLVTQAIDDYTESLRADINNRVDKLRMHA